MLSVERCFDVGGKAIIDDASTNAETLRILNDAPGRGWMVLQPARDRWTPEHGGFFGNLRYAMDMAVKGNYGSCLFLEDDEQFLWRDDDLLERVGEIFDACPDASQVVPLFFRRIHVIQAEYIESVDAYRQIRGCLTTGFWNMKKVRELGFTVPAEESEMSRWWLERGFRSYRDGLPTVGVLSYGKSNMPGLSNVAIARLALRPWDEIPYQEHYTGGPLVWHRYDRTRMRELAALRMRTENTVRHFKTWMPASMEPEPSHMKPRQRAVETFRSSIPWPRWVAPIRHFSIRNWLACWKLERLLGVEQYWES